MDNSLLDGYQTGRCDSAAAEERGVLESTSLFYANKNVNLYETISDQDTKFGARNEE